MNCAVFENELTRLLAGDIAERERPAVVKELRAHTESCASCSRSNDLLEWAALDEKERFRDEDPGEAYWASFDGRLEQRLKAEHRPASRRSLLVWTVAASLMAVVILGGWYLSGRGGSAGSDEIASGGGLPGEEIELAIPATIADEIAELEVDDQDAWLGTLPGSISYPAGLSDEDDYSEAVPYTGDLDDEGRRELLEWLREEVSGNGGGQA